MNKIVLSYPHKRKTFDLYNILRQTRRNDELVFIVKEQVECDLIRNRYSREIKIVWLNNLIDFLLEHKTVLFSYVAVEEELTLLLITDKKYELSNFDFRLPNSEIYQLVRDKYNLSLWCEAQSIPTPLVIEWTELDTLKDFKGQIIVKPRIGEGSRGIEKLSLPDDYSYLCELESTLKHSHLIQEFISSNIGVEGAFLNCRNGEVVDFYSHKRERTFPKQGGVTVESISGYNKSIFDLSKRIIRDLAWNGIIMIEFLFNIEKSEYNLIEINPRLWGSCLLSEYANKGFFDRATRDKYDYIFQSQKLKVHRIVFPLRASPFRIFILFLFYRRSTAFMCFSISENYINSLKFNWFLVKNKYLDAKPV